MMEAKRPACGGCGGPHLFDTSVPSVLWNRVIRPQGTSEYLCTSCIVRAFARAGMSFTATLWGDGFNGLPLAVEVNGATATVAYELSEQNTMLRSTLMGAHACATLRDDGTCDGCFVSDALAVVTRPAPPVATPGEER